jgi:hypothetical protein
MKTYAGLIFAALLIALALPNPLYSKPLESIGENSQIIVLEEVDANEIAEFYAKEPPLQESDIPYGLALLVKNKTEPFFNDDTVRAYAKETGVDPFRLKYIMTKLSSGFLLNMSPDYRDMIIQMEKTEKALPTAEEMKLIEKHIEEIRAALE